MLYYQCPYCGANLDPGEKCDCQIKAFWGKKKKKDHAWSLSSFWDSKKIIKN